MTKRKDYLERIETLKKRKERAVNTKEKLLFGTVDPEKVSEEHRIERIALANLVIELFDKLIAAYDQDKPKVIKDLWVEHNALSVVAAEIICEGLES